MWSRCFGFFANGHPSTFNSASRLQFKSAGSRSRTLSTAQFVRSSVRSDVSSFSGFGSRTLQCDTLSTDRVPAREAHSSGSNLSSSPGSNFWPLT